MGVGFVTVSGAWYKMIFRYHNGLSLFSWYSTFADEHAGTLETLNCILVVKCSLVSFIVWGIIGKMEYACRQKTPFGISTAYSGHMRLTLFVNFVVDKLLVVPSLQRCIHLQPCLLPIELKDFEEQSIYCYDWHSFPCLRIRPIWGSQNWQCSPW